MGPVTTGCMISSAPSIYGLTTLTLPIHFGTLVFDEHSLNLRTAFDALYGSVELMLGAFRVMTTQTGFVRVLDSICPQATESKTSMTISGTHHFIGMISHDGDEYSDSGSYNNSEHPILRAAPIQVYMTDTVDADAMATAQ
ncbi:hypothetical protein ACUV84_040932 [Puccinellia chinampoensis]